LAILLLRIIICYFFYRDIVFIGKGKTGISCNYAYYLSEKGESGRRGGEEKNHTGGTYLLFFATLQVAAAPKE